MLKAYNNRFLTLSDVIAVKTPLARLFAAYSVKNLTEQWLGVALVLIYIFGVAFKGTFAKLAYHEGSSVDTVLLWRFILSMPIFWGVMIYKLGISESFDISKKDFVGCTISGLLGFYAFVYCDYQGLALISVSMERIILFTYPVFVILLNLMINRKMPNMNQIVVLVIVQMGIAFLLVPSFQGEQSNVIGELWVFASAIFHAIYILCIQKYSPKMGAIKFTTYTMTICFTAIAINFLISSPMSDIVLNPKSAGYIMEMVVFSTVLPTFCFAAGINLIGANRASIISTMGPFITLVAGHYIFGDVLNHYQIVAGLIIFTGIASLELRRTKQ